MNKVLLLALLGLFSFQATQPIGIMRHYLRDGLLQVKNMSFSSLMDQKKILDGIIGTQAKVGACVGALAAGAYVGLNALQSGSVKLQVTVQDLLDSESILTAILLSGKCFIKGEIPGKAGVIKAFYTAAEPNSFFTINHILVTEGIMQNNKFIPIVVTGYKRKIELSAKTAIGIIAAGACGYGLGQMTGYLTGFNAFESAQKDYMKASINALVGKKVI